jgi:exosortase/archaeosortase family protein
MKSTLEKYSNHFVFRAILLVILYFSFYYSPGLQVVNAFLTENTADAAAWVIKYVLRMQAAVSEIDAGYKWHVYSPTSDGVKIAHPCNAFELYCLYIGFVVAISGVATQRKLQFAIFGTLGIYVFNVLRVVGLFVISGRWPQFFDFMHKYLFQTSAYVLMFALWYFMLNNRKREI